MSRPRVLIVEDNNELRRLIWLTLDDETLDLHEAQTGDECMTLAPQLRPDLIVLDIMMPGKMNGLQVCEALKADPSLHNTRIMLLSARGQEKDVERGKTVGADAYFVKPFSPTELAKAVHKVLQT